MGVGRLWTLINNNKDEIVEYVDLVEIAHSYPDGIKILVDFYSWEHFLKDMFWKSLNIITGNPFLIYDGGEYDLMDSFIKSFIAALRSVNIELVFFTDGAKGSSYEASQQKMKTWEKRHVQDVTGLRKCFSFLEGKIPAHQVKKEDMVRPTLQEVQNLNSLPEAGCTVHQMVSGEADCLIAKHLKEDERAYCVFSGDTDFCIFPNSKYVNHELFDLRNDLGLGRNTLTVQTPEKLMCGVISSTRLAQFLKLPNEEALVEVSILGGNDFTSTQLPRCIPGYRATYGGQIENLAAMVSQFTYAEDCPIFGDAIRSDQALRASVEHSRRFYNLTLEDVDSHDQGFIFSVIKHGVEKLKYPATMVAMHRGFYWRRNLFEDPTPGQPTAEGALAPLRAHVYAILLNHKHMGVGEYGRTERQVLEQVNVPKASYPPTLAKIYKNKFHKNLLIFKNIMLHQEHAESGSYNGEKYMELYGAKRGFVCHLLRYFLILNTGQNLFLHPREFLVLAAWVLGQHNHDRYRQWQVVPSPRCVTVENWFLILYRNAYAFLGALLGLNHEFPSPKELFSGATWVALYTGFNVNDPDRRNREAPPLSVRREDLLDAAKIVTQVVRDNRHVLEKVVKGIMPLDLSRLY